MDKKYAIIDNAGGWLVNLVMWDGNTETWNPPAGTTAVLLKDVDISTLPISPDILNDPVEIIIDIEGAGQY